MKPVVSFVTGVASFFYRFIFGDDWRVAVAVLLGLVASGLLFADRIYVWWVVPVIALAQTWVSLQRSRASRPISGPGR